jgi:dTDP-4-amino-4,6-dideoxygalactose transaminase
VASLPVTEQAVEEIFSLPLYPELEDSHVERVIAAVQDVVRRGLS